MRDYHARYPEEMTRRLAEKDNRMDIYKWNRYTLPEGFIKELGCTVRTCIDCGCLVAGGPTRCGRCTKDTEKRKEKWWKKIRKALLR